MSTVTITECEHSAQKLLDYLATKFRKQTVYLVDIDGTTIASKNCIIMSYQYAMKKVFNEDWPLEKVEEEFIKGKPSFSKPKMQELRQVKNSILGFLFDNIPPPRIFNHNLYYFLHSSSCFVFTTDSSVETVELYLEKFGTSMFQGRRVFASCQKNNLDWWGQELSSIECELVLIDDLVSCELHNKLKVIRIVPTDIPLRNIRQRLNEYCNPDVR